MELTKDITLDEFTKNMKDMNGIIYKMTNLITLKIYIGKTKEYYGLKKFGIKGRFRHHISEAYRKKKGCVLLNAAIRKYGKENFIIEKLFNCPVDEYDEKEIETIKQYDATNREKGYNICIGGGGAVVANITPEIRINLSNAQKKKHIVEPFIKKIIRNGILVGYGARRMYKGISKEKWFSSTEFTPEQNLQSIRDWLKKWDDDRIDDTGHNNRKTDLPTNIQYKKDKLGNVVGYCVSIDKDKKYYRKAFISEKDTMDEKFEMAKQWLKDFKDGKIIIDKDKNNKNPELPKNIYYLYDKEKNIIGYEVNVTKNKKKYSSRCIGNELSLGEKLEKVLEFKNKILNTK